MWIHGFRLVMESSPSVLIETDKASNGEKVSCGRDIVPLYKGEIFSITLRKTQQTTIYIFNILDIGFPQTKYFIRLTTLQNVSKRNFLCGHVLETLGSLVPEKGCGGCGIEKGENNDIGSSHVCSPCDDCIAKDLWARGKNGYEFG
ncbi:hypothetical protein TEQG_03459 [Trichophyton equinum CBS 127.97]|uniref:Uncharacterized protein n=1 Tax=Trichophyton equinum (strain ATCC MYA-4606 / CBS 127.97) TaxID=559882 RepID=F2PRS0_TRIEC|nr:hypothetical protein TEQG_03459 [Trichophyton equinum CBS 127.97]